MNVHKGIDMIEFIYWCAGLVIGSYVTYKWLAFEARKKRNLSEVALRKIANHQWNNGAKNDAMAITRIALKGLTGE